MVFEDWIGHAPIFVNVKPRVFNVVISFLTPQVPELVEEGVVFLFLKRFYHSVEVIFANVPQDLFTVIHNFDENDLITSLDSISQLGVDTLADKDYLNHSQMR